MMTESTGLSLEVRAAILKAAQEIYGLQVEIDSIEELPLDHPDRVIDKSWRDKVTPWAANEPFDEPIITHTHTVTVKYFDATHKCNYLATYGVTDTGHFYLWMD